MKQEKEYKKYLIKYIKENLGKGYSLVAIKKALITYGHDPDFAENLIKTYKIRNIIIKTSPVFLALLLLLIPAIFFYKSSITTFAVITKQYNFTDNIGLDFNESTDYVWDLENKGILKSVKLNGQVKVNGTVKIYLEHGNKIYLIFDNKQLEEKGLEEITGLLVDGNEIENISINETNIPVPINETINMTNGTIINETVINDTINITPIINETVINETTENITVENTIKINLEYKSDSVYDVNDDGRENIDSIIDLTVENTEFNWEADEDNLCTRWETYSAENNENAFVCYGSSKCCNFVELSSTREDWNDTFYLAYGQYGNSWDNLVSAQVMYVDYNLSLESAHAEIYYSEWDNLAAEFYEEFIAFGEVCVETCVLPNLNATNYKIIFEINNSGLILDSIDYGILELETFNNPPVLQKNFSNISFFKSGSYIINLSEYFYDLDNDTLIFSSYNNSGIKISIINETAILSSDDAMIDYTFFTANDSMQTATSNVFKVEVEEREIKTFNRTGLKSLREIIGLE
mgnify:CR=1 FL=1|jgi:hypothetical protein|tara:strand:- start:222 stop:1787 length:1566 start_codon:yes stop_codon:yes gene_type:complete